MKTNIRSFISAIIVAITILSYSSSRQPGEEIKTTVSPFGLTVVSSGESYPNLLPPEPADYRLRPNLLPPKPAAYGSAETWLEPETTTMPPVTATPTEVPRATAVPTEIAHLPQLSSNSTYTTAVDAALEHPIFEVPIDDDY